MSRKSTSAIDGDLEGVAGPVRDRVVLFRLLITLGAQLRARMDHRYRDSGITTQQAALLAIARSSNPPLSQGEMAEKLGVTHQNIRQLATALVKKGLLEIRSEPGDRRIKRLVPSRRAARVFVRRNAGDFAEIARWFSSLDDREARALQHQLRRLLGHLMAARSSRSPSR